MVKRPSAKAGRMTDRVGIGINPKKFQVSRPNVGNHPRLTEKIRIRFLHQKLADKQITHMVITNSYWHSNVCHSIEALIQIEFLLLHFYVI